MNSSSHSSSPSQQVSSKELKFLLRLLMHPNYRASISQVRPSAKMPAAERDRLCRQLRQKGLVGCEDTIARFSATAAGRTIVNLDSSVLPISPDEQFILRSCQVRSMSPGHINARVPKDQRQRLLEGLAQRGLIKVTRRQLGDVWLTDEGQQFLRQDCAPQGHAPALSWTLLSHYLAFMRQTPVPGPAAEENTAIAGPDDVMEIITHLDHIHRTDNYLPIYYLRDKLQPPLSRQEVDQHLYQLQRDNRIDLSTLQDVAQYSKEAITAAIPQDIGGPLFFISVVPE